MSARIKAKISEVRQYLGELGDIAPSDYEHYSRNLEKKAACERYFEKIVEALVDLAFLMVKEENLGVPEDDKQAFDVLANAGVVSVELARGLKEAKGMRNVIAHEYGSLDDELVFHAITEEIQKDAQEFVKAAAKRMHI